MPNSISSSSYNASLKTSLSIDEQSVERNKIAERGLTIFEKIERFIERFIEYVAGPIYEDNTFSSPPGEEQKERARTTGVYDELSRANREEVKLQASNNYDDCDLIEVLNIYTTLWRGGNTELTYDNEECFYKIKQAYGEQIALFIQGKIASLLSKLFSGSLHQDKHKELSSHAQDCFCRIYSEFTDIYFYKTISDEDKEKYRLWHLNDNNSFESAKKFIDPLRERAVFAHIMGLLSIDSGVPHDSQSYVPSPASETKPETKSVSNLNQNNSVREVPTTSDLISAETIKPAQRQLNQEVSQGSPNLLRATAQLQTNVEVSKLEQTTEDVKLFSLFNEFEEERNPSQQVSSVKTEPSDVSTLPITEQHSDVTNNTKVASSINEGAGLVPHQQQNHSTEQHSDVTNNTKAASSINEGAGLVPHQQQNHPSEQEVIPSPSNSISPKAPERQQSGMNDITKKLLKMMDDGSKMVPVEALSEEEKEKLTHSISTNLDKYVQGIKKCVTAQERIKEWGNEWIPFGTRGRVRVAVKEYWAAYKLGVDFAAEELVTIAQEIIKNEDKSHYLLAFEILRGLKTYAPEAAKIGLAFFQEYAQEKYESAQSSSLMANAENIPDDLLEAARFDHPQACMDCAAFYIARAKKHGENWSPNQTQTAVRWQPPSAFYPESGMHYGSDVSMYFEPKPDPNDSVKAAKQFYQRVINHRNEDEQAKSMAAEAAFKAAFLISYGASNRRIMKTDKISLQKAINLGSEEAAHLNKLINKSAAGELEVLIPLELGKIYTEKVTSEKVLSEIKIDENIQLATSFLEIVNNNPEAVVGLYYLHSMNVKNNRMPVHESLTYPKYRAYVFQTLGENALKALKSNYWEGKTDEMKKSSRLYKMADKNMTLNS